MHDNKIKDYSFVMFKACLLPILQTGKSKPGENIKQMRIKKLIIHKYCPSEISLR